MNGGYALIDLRKYDLSTDIDGASALEYTDELSKNEFDELIAKFNNARDNGKPIVVKTYVLYDSNEQRGTFFVGNYYNDGSDCIAFGYDDFVDNTRRYIAIFKYNNKYYVASVPTLWMI